MLVALGTDEVWAAEAFQIEVNLVVLAKLPLSEPDPLFFLIELVKVVTVDTVKWVKRLYRALIVQLDHTEVESANLWRHHSIETNHEFEMI